MALAGMEVDHPNPESLGSGKRIGGCIQTPQSTRKMSYPMSIRSLTMCRKFCNALFFLMLPLFYQPVLSADIENYLANTPVGSWVTMEETTQRGKKTEVTEVTRSLVGEEDVDGRRHLWIEVRTQNYKVSKKGKRKANGGPGLIKVLTDASVFDENASNILGNLQNVASRMYIKTGDKVMDMSGGGAFAGAMLQAMDTSISFEMTDLDESRDIETPLGTVPARLYQGVGDAEIKILIKTVRTHNETKMWLSEKVPFGIVETQSVTSVNGKEETASSKIIAAGMSGAQSELDISEAAQNPFAALKNLSRE